jgi:hypothetical protein
VSGVSLLSLDARLREVLIVRLAFGVNFTDDVLLYVELIGCGQP